MSSPDLRRLDSRVFEPGWSGFQEPGPVLWTGRRARVFLALHPALPGLSTGTTVGEAMRIYTDSPLPLVENPNSSAYDPSLHKALQDLADDINEDVRAACMAAFDGAYYAGVEDIIEAVTDVHVVVVMAAMQRELNRELRYRPGTYDQLPAVQLNQFPWPVQRALAERRRYRYQQFGIMRDVWKSGAWSLTTIPEDPDYAPLRLLRGMPSGNDARPREWAMT